MYSYDNERPDMVLERDRNFETITANRAKEQNPVSTGNVPFADENGEGTRKVSEIIESLLAKGGRGLYLNSQIFWDMDIHDALDEALIKAITPEGHDSPVTSSEQVNVLGWRNGHCEYEFLVEIFVEEES